MLSAWWNIEEAHLIKKKKSSFSFYHLACPFPDTQYYQQLLVLISHLPFKCIVNIPLTHMKITRAMRGELTGIKRWLNRLNDLPDGSQHFDSNPNIFYSTHAPIKLCSSLLTHSELVAWLVTSLEPRLSWIKSSSLPVLQMNIVPYLDLFFPFFFWFRERDIRFVFQM